MKQILFTVIISILIASCGTTQRTAMSSSLGASSYADFGQPDPSITQSLFTDKSSTISEENIQKILNGTYQLPKQLRVAIISLNNTSQVRRYYGTDEQYLKTQQSYLDLFTQQLGQTSRVITLAPIPDLLISQPLSFTGIREAAVRMQADVVIAYSIKSDIYSKYKLFDKADIKAFATTQLILLDVRTGLIPFSTISTKDVLSQKKKEEVNSTEAAARIQNDAVLLTIHDAGDSVVKYLSTK